MRRRLSLLLALAWALTASGCAEQNAETAPTAPGGAPIARATLVEGWGCLDTQAAVIRMPEHCAWPPALARSRIVSADIQVVSRVDARGAVVDVRVVRGPPDGAFDEAAIACARRATYRAAGMGLGVAESETCPLTVRLARYVTDLDPRTRECPPSAYAVTPLIPGGPGSAGGQGGAPGGMTNTLGCP
jgi:TonB family protein